MKFAKLFSVGVSTICGGGVIVYSLNGCNLNLFKVNASWLNNDDVHVSKWDSNWDRRDPANNSELGKATPTAVRYIFLIRHGQYNYYGERDTDRNLTKLGREQALLTGKRLQEFAHKYKHLVVSTMTRAKETAALVQESLPNNLKVIHCPLLEEGAPVRPEPPVDFYNPRPCEYFEDGARIEAAFRKYIHRADPEQKGDSYEIIVCHGNVIRYFICRALQVPVHAWMRIGIHHASITGIAILPNGRVVLSSINDSGHLPAKLVTEV